MEFRLVLVENLASNPLASFVLGKGFLDIDGIQDCFLGLLFDDNKLLDVGLG